MAIIMRQNDLSCYLKRNGNKELTLIRYFFIGKVDIECFGNMISLKYDIFESWYVIISFYVIRLYSSYNVDINIGQIKRWKMNFDNWTKTFAVIWNQNIFQDADDRITITEWKNSVANDPRARNAFMKFGFRQSVS